MAPNGPGFSEKRVLAASQKCKQPATLSAQLSCSRERHRASGSDRAPGRRRSLSVLGASHPHAETARARWASHVFCRGERVGKVHAARGHRRRRATSGRRQRRSAAGQYPGSATPSRKRAAAQLGQAHDTGILPACRRPLWLCETARAPARRTDPREARSRPTVQRERTLRRGARSQAGTAARLHRGDGETLRRRARRQFTRRELSQAVSIAICARWLVPAG